jgi:secreted Zn-dependent insulinase-like peptidase
MPGLAFVVQSPNASPEKINLSNERFLDFVSQKLNKMTTQDLTKFKQSLTSRYETQERNIYQRSSRFWQELNTQVYNFDQQQQLIKALNKIEIKNLTQAWQGMIKKRVMISSKSNALRDQEKSN